MNSRYNISYSRIRPSCCRFGYGSCPRKLFCRCRNKANRSILRSHNFPHLRLTDRNSRYIFLRSCLPIPNEDKNNWRKYIDIRHYSCSFRICRRSLLPVRFGLTRSLPVSGHIDRTDICRRSCRRRRPVRPDSLPILTNICSRDRKWICRDKHHRLLLKCCNSDNNNLLSNIFSGR